MNRASPFPPVTIVALALLCWRAPGRLSAADGITNVRAGQRPGTALVDIRYDLATVTTNPLFVTVTVSTNGGVTYDLPATNFTGDVGFGVRAGPNKLVVWQALRDWPGGFSTNIFFRLGASDAPAGMVLIPAGPFTMGNALPGEGYDDEIPLHTNQISAFYMDKFEVTQALWDQVYPWAVRHGYGFDNGGSGKATNHPVDKVSWYDVVKWCNARSEMEGRVAAYYTSAARTTVYRIGQLDVQNDWVKWNVGCRLPTEAEWEKAARGGTGGHRFPWTDAETITHSRANYYSSSEDAYDVSPSRDYHPTFATGAYPYTSPAGYFAPNGYGLYDMAGNVWEWCWDWYGVYGAAPAIDPRGPVSARSRVFRGGCWAVGAIHCRAAYRFSGWPYYGYGDLGFRSVLPPAPGEGAGVAVVGPVTVEGCLEPAVGGAVIAVGATACLPLSIESDDALTRLVVTLDMPANRFADCRAAAVAPDVESATAAVVSATRVAVIIDARPGQTFRGPNHVADVCFRLVPPQTSAFLPIEIVDIEGRRRDGSRVGSTAGRAGRVTAVGAELLLGAFVSTNGQTTLRLYAPPGTRARLETTTSLTGRIAWVPDRTLTVPAGGLFATLEPICTANCPVYIRARRE